MARIKSRTPDKDSVKELIQLAIDLDLTALAEALPDLLEKAEKGNPAFTDFAIQMLRTEIAVRQKRRIDRSLRCSGLGTVEGLEGFRFEIRPGLDPRVVKELLNCQFIEQRRNLLFLGSPGLGKTRIAKAILHAACLAGYSVLYVVTAEMIEQLHASHADGTFNRAMRRYTKPDVIFLDEFGYEPFTVEATNYLFRVVRARHQQGSIVLAANTGFKRWMKLFPSEATAVATVDRLVDRATILRFSGVTWRDPELIIGAPLEDE